MAECPKCHQHLRLTDWKQTCPHCGANIVLYDLQERLMQEADKAEVEYYHFQKKVDRMKTAFVGSKLAIVRIFTSLLPLLAIFLPLMKVDFREPLEPFMGNFGAIQLYNMIDKLDMKVYSQLLTSEETKAAAILLGVSAVCLILSIVIMLIRFVCLTMACGRRGKLRNYIFDIIFLVLAAAACGTVLFIPGNPVISAEPAFGAVVYLILVIVNFAVDAAVFRQGLEVTHAQCYVGGIPIEEYFKMVDDGVPPEELRAEMYRRLTEIQKKKDAELKEKQEEQDKKEGGE